MNETPGYPRSEEWKAPKQEPSLNAQKKENPQPNKPESPVDEKTKLAEEEREKALAGLKVEAESWFTEVKKYILAKIQEIKLLVAEIKKMEATFRQRIDGSEQMLKGYSDVAEAFKKSDLDKSWVQYYERIQNDPKIVGGRLKRFFNGGIGQNALDEFKKFTKDFELADAKQSELLKLKKELEQGNQQINELLEKCGLLMKKSAEIEKAYSSATNLPNDSRKGIHRPLGDELKKNFKGLKGELIQKYGQEYEQIIEGMWKNIYNPNIEEVTPNHSA